MKCFSFVVVDMVTYPTVLLHGLSVSLWRLILFVLGGVVLSNLIYAQDAIVPLGSPTYQLIERCQIRGLSEFHSAIKPYNRRDVFSIAYRLAGKGSRCLDPENLRYLLSDNDEYFSIDSLYADDSNAFVRTDTYPASLTAFPPVSRAPIWGIFYARPAHLVALDARDFYLRVNPILHFGLGKERERDGLLFVNRRGLELRGGIDRKVFFYTNIIEAQLRPASYIKGFVEERRALPDAGLYKDFDGRIFTGDGSYDYLTSSGYVGFNVTKHIGIQIGHGKNFIGDGYRSLFLSDFAKNYFYLKFNTRIWKFHYQNVFAEFAAREKLPGNVVVPKKYFAAHYLSFQVRPNFELGLFEAVLFARDENQFELQYLNPIILYRSIEHHVGSPDNVLLGFSARWDIARRVRLYSQFVLDEFKLSEFLSSRNWWGNKSGVQVGIKYLDVLGVQNLVLQLEYNRVRPFTYTHYDSLGSYSHFNQPLAHPAGANFSEVLLNLEYRPVSRLVLSGKSFLIDSGQDTEEVFYGANILRSNVDRNADYGVSHRQGVPVQNLMLSFTATYMLKYNLFLEARYFRRNYDSDVSTEDLLTQYFTLGVRWNYFSAQDEF